MLVGPVASGKTSLLEAIVGEARLLGGSVEFAIPAHVAYCGQDAWLLNQSVRDNILAFTPYNPKQYREVVAACQLEDDLRQFPKGDASIIGSRGISLSGGQKQRVALARALYNRTPVVLLDDIFKGLDADTYAKCFAATLGPRGLLRRDRTAIIMATHNCTYQPTTVSYLAVYISSWIYANSNARLIQCNSSPTPSTLPFSKTVASASRAPLPS